MHFSLRTTFLATMVLIPLTMCSIQAQEQEAAPLRVLILNTYDESSEPYAQINQAFSVEFAARYAQPIAFFQFDLNLRNASALNDNEAKVALLRGQYGDGAPDLVVAFGPPAINFWLLNRLSLFPEARFVAAAAEMALDRSRFSAGDTVVATRFSFSDATRDILQLLPETRHILLVFGASSHERVLSSMASSELQGPFPDIDLEFTNDLTVQQLQDRVANLGAGSVVFHAMMDSDAAGVLLGQHRGLSLVRERSKVPVFGPFDDQLGRGIVGGRLIALEQRGVEMADLALESLRQRPTAVAWRVRDLTGPVYDWRELQAWGIDPDRLPEASTIRFKPPSLWEQHASVIILAALLFAAQMLLIILLLLERRRARRAEHLNADLGRKLISAHEDERRLIARELHDDLSQRLARLAIDASILTSQPGSPSAREVLQGLQPELVRISKDVHDLSYRLHPALLDDLGLSEALRAECERLQRHSDAKILVRIDDFEPEFPRDTALCIYRIGQEAMQNAVKYARAKTIEIALHGDDRALSLSVQDDGIGFDEQNQSRGAGLGLSSMRERARLAGGSLEIRSRRGQGTAVTISVTRKGVAA